MSHRTASPSEGDESPSLRPVGYVGACQQGADRRRRGEVSGLTIGVGLLPAGLPVRIVAEEIPGRTSLAAGALWGPYHAEPWDKVRAWSLTSLQAFRDLSEASDSVST